MSISVNNIDGQLAELKKLKEQFVDLCAQSEGKINKIIETARIFRDRMEPLNREMQQLQVQQKNLGQCRTALTKVQAYRKTGKEVSNIIYEGPSTQLERYLQAMEQIQASLLYFRQNNPDDVEYSRLQALYSAGLNSLDKEFEGILRQTFPPINVTVLLKVVEDGAGGQSLTDVTEVSPKMLKNLRFLADWLNRGDADVPQRSQKSGPNTDLLKGCLTRYCEHRRQNLRLALGRLREYLAHPDLHGSSVALSTRSKNSILVPAFRTTQKRIPTKALGLVWDANVRRQLNDNETEDLDSEHYATALTALVKLMQNEQVWLERLQLCSTPQEMCTALEVIFKAAANELLSEGTTLTRLMSRAQSRGEFHMVLSLIVVLKRFAEIGEELSRVLSTLDHLRFAFVSLVGRLLQQSQTSLDVYVEYLRQATDRSGTLGAVVVPADGTIHELATNAVMHLENLVEYADVVGTAFGFGDLTAAGERSSTPDALTFLCTYIRDREQTTRKVGDYLVQALRALITNLDIKSEFYTEEVLRLVFQMNNLQYILSTMKSTKLFRYMAAYQSESLSHIASLLEERKVIYTRWCVRALPMPNPASIGRQGGPSTRALDSRERMIIKNVWNDFNAGFANLVKQHGDASIPDRELRESLGQAIIAELVPRYRALRERSLQLTFTTNQEKYIRMTVDEFEQRLRRLFG